MSVLRQKHDTEKRGGRGLLLRSFALLGLFSLLFAVACGDDTKKPGCTADSECSSNQTCKAGKCEDKATPSCVSDSECAANEECKAGICQAKPSTGCKEDSDCAANEECKASKCEKKPATGCTSDSDCATTETCDTSSGTCKAKDIPGCKNDGDCKTEETCDTSTGKCNPKPTGCQNDGDCKPEETCASGVCKPKVAPGCKTDADCGTGKECKAGKCENKPGPGCGSCQLDEYCFNNDRCLKKNKDCTEEKDCAATEACVTAGPRQFCLNKCDPSTNTSQEDRSNSACWNKWGWCIAISQTDPKLGVCTPPQSKTRKKDEDCGNFDKPDKPEYNLCEGDLQCSSGKCVDGCDPSKGSVTNPKCTAGQYCAGTGTTGTCTALPEKKKGSVQAGGDCSNVTTEKFCDGDKDLFCAFPKCTKACDPRKGKDSNPNCGANDECLEQTSNSHLGGACVPKPSKKAGESCNSSDQRCVSGLNCAWSKCAKECDNTKPQTGCGADEHCYSTYKACTKKCDPANGKTANTACGTGNYCVSSTTTYKPGYCRPLPDYKEGKVPAGGDCSTFDDTKFCEGSKQFFCYTSKCFKACDFSKGATNNADCGGDDCQETTTSPLGGVCLPKATRTPGQECNSTDKRCASGLSCDASRCAKACDGTKPQPAGCANDEWCFTSTNACRKKCDPANGVTGNTSCGSDGFCQSSSTTYKPGYCRGLPPKKTGTKKEGEDCSNFTAARFCDGNADLVCNATSLKCFKACDPSKGKDNNTKCGANDECLPYTAYSHLGGICQPKPSQKLDEECDTAVKKCIAGLTCISFGSKAACQQDCDPAKTGECPAGSKCETLTSGAGVCIKELTKTRKLHEPCRGLPNTPGYNDCDPQFICAGVSGSDAHCLDKCDPANSQCPTNYVCLPLSSGSGGVCGQKCTDKADCTTYGSACQTLGTDQVCI